MLGYGSSDSPQGDEIYYEKQQAKKLLVLIKSLNIAHWTLVMRDAGGTRN
jgi:haloalkane dehalogenase